MKTGKESGAKGELEKGDDAVTVILPHASVGSCSLSDGTGVPQPKHLIRVLCQERSRESQPGAENRNAEHMRCSGKMPLNMPKGHIRAPKTECQLVPIFSFLLMDTLGGSR